MSFLAYYLILHLCVSMHACNSRPLGLQLHKEPAKRLRLSSKTTEIMAELEGINNDENNMEEKESKLELLPDEENMHIGSDVKTQVSHEETIIKVWKNHARSTMEIKQKDSKEAIHNSKDGSVTEDVVVMDYAQAHRKPPIHNIEP